MDVNKLLKEVYNDFGESILLWRHIEGAKYSIKWHFKKPKKEIVKALQPLYMGFPSQLRDAITLCENNGYYIPMWHLHKAIEKEIWKQDHEG